MDQKANKTALKMKKAPKTATGTAFTSQGSLVQVQYRPPSNFNNLVSESLTRNTGDGGASAPQRRPLLPVLDGKTAERFWSKVARGAPNECWPWLGSKKKSRDSYGHFKIRSYWTVTASRVAYAIGYGEEPGESSILHHCDNPPCCNPAHLYPGTTKDNSEDMVKRGRARNGMRKGSSNGANKLTARAVYDIWRCIRRGQNNCQIGRRFGVHHSTISVIRLGKFWTHITSRLPAPGVVTP